MKTQQVGLKAEQRVGEEVIRIRFKPSVRARGGHDVITLDLLNPNRNRFAVLDDPTEEAVALIRGAAETGFLAPLVDYLLERHHESNILAAMACLLAG